MRVGFALTTTCIKASIGIWNGPLYLLCTVPIN